MRMLVSQANVGPIVSLGVTPSGEPADLASAPLLASLPAGADVLLSIGGTLGLIAATAFQNELAGGVTSAELSSAVSAEAETRSAADAALGSSITSLSASLSQLSAGITPAQLTSAVSAEASTRADEDATLAASISSLSSTVAAIQAAASSSSGTQSVSRPPLSAFTASTRGAMVVAKDYGATGGPIVVLDGASGASGTSTWMQPITSTEWLQDAAFLMTYFPSSEASYQPAFGVCFEDANGILVQSGFFANTFGCANPVGGAGVASNLSGYTTSFVIWIRTYFQASNVVTPVRFFVTLIPYAFEEFFDWDGKRNMPPTRPPLPAASLATPVSAGFFSSYDGSVTQAPRGGQILSYAMKQGTGSSLDPYAPFSYP